MCINKVNLLIIIRVSLLNLKEYKLIVKENSRKENIIKNVFLAFLSGGMLGLLGEIFIKVLESFNIENGYLYLTIILIFIASLLTGLGFFDKVVSFFKCGLIVPTTGFAHAMSACALDNKSDGFIKGVGSNIFRMVGSIIMYGVISSFLFAIIKGVIL